MQTFLADVCNFKSENKRIKFYFVPMEKKFSARITIAHMGIIALKGTHSIVLDRANMFQKSLISFKHILALPTKGSNMAHFSSISHTGCMKK